MKKTLTFYSALFLFFLVLQRGSGVLTKIILANGISPYEYGLITFVAISIPSMFQILTELNYFVLCHSEEGKKYFGLSLAITLLLTFIISTILLLMRSQIFQYLNLPQEGWDLFYFVIFISLLSMSIVGDFQGLFTGLKLYSLPGLIVTLPSIVRLLVIAVLISLGITSFEVIILVFAISNVIPLIFIILSRDKRKYFSEILNIKWPTKKIMVFGIAVLIVSNFSASCQYITKIIVSHELGVVWQGYYDVSLTLASIIVFTLGTMAYISIPEATTSDKNEVFKKGGLGDVTRGLFAFTLLFVIFLYFYSDYIVIHLFSDAYLMGARYAFIMAIGFIFLYFQVFLANLNLSSAKEVKDFVAICLAPLILLPISFFLTSYLIKLFQNMGYGNGFIGAYISNTLLLIILTALTVVISKDLSPVKIITDKIGRLFVSVLATFLFLFIFNPRPLIGLVAASVLFTVLVIITGYLDKAMILDIFQTGEDRN